MRIGEVAKQANIPASTLRYYERIGLIAPPQRKSGQRDYDDGILDILQIIQMAKSAGFSLTDIRLLIEAYNTDGSLSDIWRAIAAHRLVEVEQTIQHYQTIQQTLAESINCTCDDLMTCQMLA